MKVLVSAFKPFNSQKINYSAEVLKYIEGVDKCIIDVVYDGCFEELSAKADLEEYGLIIALGEARSRSELTLELQAVNISSCSLADNGGNVKRDEKIDLSAPEVLNTKVKTVKCEGDILFSHDAGKFVCNNLYFHLLRHYPERAIFIHIPDCRENPEKYAECARRINVIIEKLTC